MSQLDSPDHPAKGTPSRDEAAIEGLGYHPAYRRVFKTLGSVGAVLSVASPNGVFVTSYYQFVYGGYWGLSWGWIIPAILMVSQPLAVAELCSAMPVNGAFYWWAAALGPKRVSRVLSFVAGWINCISLITSLASFSYAVASSWAVIISMLHPQWIPTNAQIMGVAMGLVILWGLLGALRMEKFTWLFIITTSIVVLINLTYVVALPTTHSVQDRRFATGAQVFGEYTNFSLWNKGVAVPMSMFTAAWVITGWQAPAFIVEETQNAQITAPRAIITSYSSIAIGGAIVSLVTAFCTSDITAAATDPSGNPMFILVIDHWGLKLGAAFLMTLMSTIAMGGPSLLLTSASQVAAFARDGGLPFPHVFSYIHPRTNMPVATMGLLVVGALLILLFSLSVVARTIIYSLAVIANMMTYALPIFLRLTCSHRFVPGPFNYGRLSKPIHLWALLTMVYLVVMECFPASPVWDAESFNYNWAILCGLLLVSMALWFGIGPRYTKFDLQIINGQMQQRGHTFIDGQVDNADEQGSRGKVSRKHDV
ncbi:Amino acid transporter [Fusarium keratoplasticum]|uniref:Amino acid transporter n=1 Tax=Fusarium keratoplasticum TaxID=1328300 RepID=A0ACC0QJ99_9HYPO|nr:Amino acid transporter [Fusarium keratoplasticum]KAI8654766.1 Amino acid transporter [Fusarium keratoplasticum]KAI8655613.1 Amino acid transporter [Fusarium keratoplasticum]